MNLEQEIKNLQRELMEISNDYYCFRVSLYYKACIVIAALLLGLIAGFLL